MNNDIIIRQALPTDAPFVGHVVAMAVELDGKLDKAGNSFDDIFGEIAAKADSQYSYNNTLIAEVDGKIAGALVNYDGANLHSLRDSTMEVLLKYHPGLEIVEDEVDADEFYFDSLAVLPEYRGMGVGRMLLTTKMNMLKEAGYRRCGLLVDYDNPDAERLYHSLGFRPVGTRNFFGRSMKHMQKSL